MTTTIEPVRLTDAQLQPASEVLARAFFDDPFPTYVEPDDERRQRMLPGFMRIGAAIGQRFGDVYAPTSALEAAAVWLAPDPPEFTPEILAEAGAGTHDREMSEAARARFELVMATWGALHGRDMPMPHWYLMILGVDPPRQGQGVGGGLIAPMLARADAEDLPCYLETAKERNVAFYERHGFRVLVEDTMPHGGFRSWTMRRDPRS